MRDEQVVPVDSFLQGFVLCRVGLIERRANHRHNRASRFDRARQSFCVDSFSKAGHHNHPSSGELPAELPRTTSSEVGRFTGTDDGYAAICQQGNVAGAEQVGRSVQEIHLLRSERVAPADRKQVADCTLLNGYRRHVFRAARSANGGRTARPMSLAVYRHGAALKHEMMLPAQRPIDKPIFIQGGAIEPHDQRANASGTKSAHC
ncbi:hypothetical protein ASE95_02945 [Sphingomonas sp. Leaf231]|nr:hypothetical protein ASE95_02945 [Sphingomonas sp. Leaf231]